MLYNVVIQVCFLFHFFRKIIAAFSGLGVLAKIVEQVFVALEHHNLNTVANFRNKEEKNLILA